MSLFFGKKLKNLRKQETKHLLGVNEKSLSAFFALQKPLSLSW
jgi:hypothetical protein